nr:hypothetical protein Iba_chr14eCG11250 [Ipomoea batatas]
MQLTASHHPSVPTSSGTHIPDINFCSIDDNRFFGPALQYASAKIFKIQQLLTMNLSTHLGGCPTQSSLLRIESLELSGLSTFFREASDSGMPVLCGGRSSSMSVFNSSGSCCNTELPTSGNFSLSQFLFQDITDSRESFYWKFMRDTTLSIRFCSSGSKTGHKHISSNTGTCSASCYLNNFLPDQSDKCLNVLHP